ncbi:MAG: site-specific integrase [Clostridiales bacterium]|nr:site-specific integrase [Clostridiales bacterium]
MKEIKLENHYEKKARIALSIPEQAAFIDFVKDSRFSYLLPMFTVFLGTGMRVGELTGLQWHDLNFKKRTISIERTMNYYKRDGEKCVFHIGTPKSKAGIRTIPMLPEVKSAFLKERQKQMMLGGCNACVDGYADFVFTTTNGTPYTKASVDYTINCIIRAYNKQETGEAEKECREPLLLPKFSVHNLRHTFITRFCENETNLKVIQEIAGHADIATTMNIYNKATAEAKQDSFKNLEGKIKIS